MEMANPEDDIKSFLDRLDGPPTEITVERVITDDGITGTVYVRTIRIYPDGRRETIKEEPRPWRGKGKEELV